MFQLIRLFRKKKPVDAIVEGEFLWCIVGNIVDKHYYGEEKEIKSGTKHFRPGAKVYCIPEFGGIAHEQIRVVGRPRNSNSFISVIIPTKRIKKFRLQKVYSPTVFELISEYHIYRVNNTYRLSYEELSEIMELLATYTEEIQD